MFRRDPGRVVRQWRPTRWVLASCSSAWRSCCRGPGCASGCSRPRTALVAVCFPALGIAQLSASCRPRCGRTCQRCTGIFLGGVGGIAGALLLGGVQSRYGDGRLAAQPARSRSAGWPAAREGGAVRAARHGPDDRRGARGRAAQAGQGGGRAPADAHLQGHRLLLRAAAGAVRRELHRGRRRDGRAARHQRRRQVHAAEGHQRHRAAHVGQRPLPRPGHHLPRRRAAHPARHHPDPRRPRRVRAADGDGEPALLRLHPGQGAQAARRPDRRGARGLPAAGTSGATAWPRSSPAASSRCSACRRR